jgi:hypothetical protein
MSAGLVEAEVHRRAFLEGLVGRGVQRVDSGHRGKGGATDYAVCVHIVQEGVRTRWIYQISRSTN